MSATKSSFKDWQADEAAEFTASRGTGSRRQRPALLVDDDFSWSEPAPRRRTATATVEWPRRRTAISDEAAWDETGLDFDHELDEAWNGRLSATTDAGREYATGRPSATTDSPEYATTSRTEYDHLAVEYIESWDEATLEPVPEGRRTVVITGHGAEPEIPVGPRRRRESGLRVHEREGFNPDRVAMWAFVLGVLLIFGAIVH